jgi:hypothetical protein
MIMEDRVCPEGMTPEQFAEAQRLMDVTARAVEDERWRMCCLMASQQNSGLLGATEFRLRDLVLRVGAHVLEAAANQRRKKGGTMAAASRVPTASTMPALSGGGRRRS